jgi:hypothetical protein
MMSRLKLTVNESKTRVCRLPEEKFDFLGYTFGRCYSPKTGRTYWGTTPSKKRVQRLCRAISEMTRRSQTQQDATTLVAALNRKINGWANYFCLGPVSQALPSRGATYVPVASPVAVRQTQRAGRGEYAVSPESLASEVWLGSPYCADRQFSVGDGVNLFSESWMR